MTVAGATAVARVRVSADGAPADTVAGVAAVAVDGRLADDNELVPRVHPGHNEEQRDDKEKASLHGRPPARTTDKHPERHRG